MSRRRHAVRGTLQRWERPREGRLLGGVCASIAEQTGVHALLVRLAFLVLLLSKGIGIAIYALLWLVLPEEGEQLRRGPATETIQARLSASFGELRRGAGATVDAVFREHAGDSWPHQLDRFWLGLGLSAVGVVGVLASFGAFDWLTPGRALGLLAVVIGLGLLWSARARNRQGGPTA